MATRGKRRAWALRAAYILDTLPIVRRHDKSVFRHYRTQDTILACYSAFGRRRNRDRCCGLDSLSVAIAPGP